MFTLGLAYTPKIQNRYPHMLQEDIIIWRRFIENGDFLPDVVWYDIHCGNHVGLSVDDPDWMKQMSLGITRKRIDVVGRVGSSYWIIEVKPRATYDAFGQVIFYAEQFKKDYKKNGQIYPVIITDFVDKDILPLCDEIGILVFEVGTKLQDDSG